MHHITTTDWLTTPDGNPRGYIDTLSLKELWIHTGTDCNLGCPFCFEDSKPGDTRIELIAFDEAKRYIDEAVALGVEKLSFTGGEPFVNTDFLKILDYALDYKPCMVLTNGTGPIRTVFDDVIKLQSKKYDLKFRVSIDYPNEKEHDASRGKGNFRMSFETLSLMHKNGFAVSIARYGRQSEDKNAVEDRFREIFQEYNLPADTNIIVFYNLFKAHKSVEVPFVSENCMTTYKDEKSRAEFMCAYSRMIVKKNGSTGVYACTLVDDDEDYDLGKTIAETLGVRVMLKHHRCYSCFAAGTCCSE
ncbi:MAG: radical SAM protein [Calditrichaeota bacterium]|nr:MAG: radical SAM protein [Calditrichota bacterium]